MAIAAADIATAVWFAGRLEQTVTRRGWSAPTSLFFVMLIGGCVSSAAWIVHVQHDDYGLVEWLQMVRAGGLE